LPKPSTIIFFVASIIIYALILNTLSQPIQETESPITVTPTLTIYKDAECTRNLTKIAWGTLYPATSKNVTFYIKTNIPQSVTVTNNNNIPYLTLPQLNLGVVNPEQPAQATLTLTVAPNASACMFQIKIWVTGTA
jgi:hypothetical protein